MVTSYTKDLVGRAFAPTPGITDILPALVAFGLAVYARAKGVEVSDSTTVSILAYLGAFVVLTMVLRLFVTAPYVLWREQYAEAGRLRIELSKPERIEYEYMARKRARKRVKLAAELRQLHWLSKTSPKQAGRVPFDKTYNRIYRLMAEVAAPEGFREIYAMFQTESSLVWEAPERSLVSSNTMLLHMESYLHGRIDAEGVALRLADLVKAARPVDLREHQDV